MKTSFVFVLCVCLFSAAAVNTQAATVPGRVNYQGFLTAPDGTPMDTLVNMTFNIYPLPAGGASAWSETHTNVQVTNGLFDVQLGESSFLHYGIFSDDSLWLGVTVGTNTEMTPRTRFLAVPYAYRVQSVNEAYGGSINSQLFIADKVNVGIGNSNSGANAFVAGNSNMATGNYSTVTGGRYNRARGEYSVVCGGGSGIYADSNSASGQAAFLGAGSLNRSSGNSAVVVGGYDNRAIANTSTVGGGASNEASGPSATIGGGGSNMASDTNATISGGFMNTAHGVFSTVGGGRSNHADSNYATIGGGRWNFATGLYSVVAGGGDSASGTGNAATGNHAFIGCGSENMVPGDYSAVVDGYYNIASGNYSFLGGGAYNEVENAYSTLSGGYSNAATGYASTIAGGYNGSAQANYTTVAGGSNNDALGNYATVAGGYSNEADTNNCTVSGGYNNEAAGHSATVSGGYYNLASGDYSVVGGGVNNRARGFNSVVAGGGGVDVADSCSAIGVYAVVSGGRNNIAQGFYSAVGGGAHNYAIANGSMICGGNRNRARGEFAFVGGGGGETLTDSNSANGNYSVVSGGARNDVKNDYGIVCGGYSNYDSGFAATIGGGYNNTIYGNYSTIPGGRDNVVAGNYSFAAGRKAQAYGNGSFVWGDQTNDTVTSWNNNEFVTRATGGFYFRTNVAGTAGAKLTSGSSAWVAISDSTKKRNIRLVDTKEVLDKVANLPIKQWSYKAQDPSIEHIGPMAQDFWKQFHLGEDSLGISTIDPDGIALAAIQELVKRCDALESQNREMQNEIIVQRSQIQSLTAGQDKTVLEPNHDASK